MNTETGQLVNADMLQQLPQDERAKFVEVKRDLSEIERANMQIRLYSPCGCGSGKKFKFCCKKPSLPARRRSL